MGKIDIHVKSDMKQRRLASIEHNFVDKSIYLTFVRAKGKTKGYSTKINALTGIMDENKENYEDRERIKKVSYHTSGAINFHNLSGNRIIGDPLYDIKDKFFFIEYQINDIDKLTTKDHKETDIILELPKKTEQQNYAFAFSVSPTKSDESISLEFYGGLFYLEIDFSVVKCYDEKNIMPFHYLTPSIGKHKHYPETNACIVFHQKLNETSGIIIYEADQSGIYTIIFDEVRRSIPRKENMLVFSNPYYEAIFTTIKEHYARFKVKDRRNGQNIIEKDNLIKKLIFDNEI